MRLLGNKSLFLTKKYVCVKNTAVIAMYDLGRFSEDARVRVSMWTLRRKLTL